MSAPEARARELIDRQLSAAGWVLQHREEFDRTAGRGVAVREFPLPAGEADYFLFVDGRAAGVVEAKKGGTTLSGFAEQSEKYLTQLPEYLDAWADPLPFGYESAGIETRFRDLRDPRPRSRPVFALHKPETLAEWLARDDTLRRRLQQMPPLVTHGLRGCQIEAIENLERSLAADHPCSLIQMATGSGKTSTACGAQGGGHRRADPRLARAAPGRGFWCQHSHGDLGLSTKDGELVPRSLCSDCLS